jgi:hypothetical protein
MHATKAQISPAPRFFPLLKGQSSSTPTPQKHKKSARLSFTLLESAEANDGLFLTQIDPLQRSAASDRFFSDRAGSSLPKGKQPANICVQENRVRLRDKGSHPTRGEACEPLQFSHLHSASSNPVASVAEKTGR